MPKKQKIKTLTWTVLEDNSDMILQMTEEKIKLALDAIGIQAVGHAVTNITSMGAVDTGLLRNSITYAVSGQSTHKKTYHADNVSKYSKVQAMKVGRYGAEKAPEDPKGKCTVYIGTNVEYAPYIEMGTVKNKVAKPFLRFALEQHIEEYRQIFLKHLGGE